MPRGMEGYDGRRKVTQQENFRDIQSIKQYLFRLLVIGGFLFLIFVGAVAALLYFSFEVAAHRSTLEDIEKQTEQALLFLMEVLNSTNEVTRDITDSYVRAKMAHQRNVGRITEEDYQAYLSDNGDVTSTPTSTSTDDPFIDQDHESESYTAHFMHILLQALPLQDEDEMTSRFKNFFDGFDSFMCMLGEANRTGLVSNTTLMESRINRALYSNEAQHLATQGADLASRAMTHSDELVRGFLATNHSIAHVLGRLDELSRTKLADVLLENKHDVLKGIGHLGEESYDALHETMKFVKSEEGKKLMGDAEDIVDALNRFHTAKKATQVLQFLLTFGSRTLNIDVDLEDKDEHEEEDPGYWHASSSEEARGMQKGESPLPTSTIAPLNKERNEKREVPKQMPLRGKKGRKRSRS
jgi:hypothetical protein